MCKTMYWSEKALLNGYILIFKTRIISSTVSLTCCERLIFAAWINFCSFCRAKFQESIWEGSTTSIIWLFSYMVCFLFKSPLYAYWFLHSNSVCHFWFLFGFNSWARFYSCLCSFSRVFFEDTSVVSFLMFKFSGPSQYLSGVSVSKAISIRLPVSVFPKQVCLEMSSSAFLI